jgi:hypothetical protein
MVKHVLDHEAQNKITGAFNFENTKIVCFESVINKRKMTEAAQDRTVNSKTDAQNLKKSYFAAVKKFETNV